MSGTIGKTPTGQNVGIDVDRLIVSRLLVQANSGAGKSWALRRLLEQTHGQVQQIVLDVEGEFYTLREKGDYILARAGERDRDCPAEPRGAALLGRKLLELGVSAVVDIYELKAHERLKFARLFLDALVNAPRELWHPCLVVVDEAHVFCPQRGEAESASAVIDLMTRGRKRGFCGVLATQRLSKLHKDAAAEANNKLIGRSSLDVDLDRAGDELGFAKNERVRLRTLEPGHFFAFGPALAPTVTEVIVGPVATTHPKPGQRAASAPPPRAKVQKVLGQLADLPREAEEEARTLAEAKARVRDLERELRTARAAQPPAPPAERIEVPVLGPEHARVMERWSGMAEVAKNLAETALGIKSDADDVVAAVGRANEQPKYFGGVDLGRKPAKSVVVQTASPPRASHATEGVPLDRGMHKALTVLAQYPEGRTKSQVAILTGYASGGGRFNNILSALRSAGYAVGADSLRITDAGLRNLGDWEPLPAGRDLLNYWLGKMGSGEARVLSAIVEAYPRSLTRDEVAAASEYEAGGGRFNNILSYLRTLGLIEGRAELRASEALFG